jgi:ABC-type bacteriocin/lantibiotic exporter with double-glycine peptidase domain
MPKTLLAVSHLRQQAESDCLPVCAQMVLSYLGRSESYEHLARLLGTRWFGTPSENILRLEQLDVQVTLRELSLAEIEAALIFQQPVIAFVSTADLPYWSTASDHVVVIVGIDEQFVYVNDPFFAEAPQRVPRPSFELAQQRFDYRCALLALG